VRAAVRALDAAGLLLGLLLVVLLAGGGFKAGSVALRRPEDVFLALMVVLAIRALLAPLPRLPLSPRRLVIGAVILYAVLMGFITLTRHWAFRTHALDLGQFAQIAWSIANGDGPWMTLPAMHAWGDHFSPILYLLAPLAFIAPITPALLIAQTLSLAAGGLVVFAFARRHLSDERVAASLAVLYLANPSLHGINLRDIHVQAFAIPLLLAAALAWDTRHWTWCAVALVLVAACREDAALVVIGFAIWLALARGRWMVAGAVAAAAGALLVFDTRVLIPSYRHEAYTHLVKRYAHLGNSVGDVVLTLLVRPWRWIPVLLQTGKLVYLILMLAPLAFLPLLAPLAAAGALPGLAVNLLTFDRVLFSHRTQYQSFVLPFFVLAAVEACARLEKRVAARGPDATPGWRARLTPRFLLGAGLLVSLALTARTVNDLGVDRWRLNAEQRALRALVARVPAGVPISVNERLVPHLAQRHEAYIYDTSADRSQYVLELDTELARRPPPPGFVVEAREQGWTLLRRGR
jgi:uncharacterized membrane protein